MRTYYADDWLTVHCGDVRAILPTLDAESVHCVVTSPPYWGLRDYGLAPGVWGGNADHEHEWGEMLRVSVDNTDKRRWNHAVNGRGEEQPDAKRIDRQSGSVERGATCACGAWRGCLGLEPTPEAYVAHVVDVFREVRRVLRKDATVWLNLGDSYASHDPGDRRDGSFLGPTGQKNDKGRRAGPAVRNRAGVYRTGTLKPKDRVMIPARVALALQADGWWLRDEIVWHKPNAMPSSVTDRTTPAHEMVYLLTKRARYYYDSDAVREPAKSGPSDLRRMADGRDRIGGLVKAQDDPLLAASGLTNIGRKRSVGGRALGTHGTIHRQGREAATPREMAATGLNASTERTRVGMNGRWDDAEAEGRIRPGRNKRSVWTVATQPYAEAHFATFPEALIEPMILAGCPPGGIVLDPFGGSGTTAMVANRLGRRAIYIDANEAYAAQALRRISAARSRGDAPGLDMPIIPFADDGLWASEVPA